MGVGEEMRSTDRQCDQKCFQVEMFSTLFSQFPFG